MGMDFVSDFSRIVHAGQGRRMAVFGNNDQRLMSGPRSGLTPVLTRVTDISSVSCNESSTQCLDRDVHERIGLVVVVVRLRCVWGGWG